MKYSALIFLFSLLSSSLLAQDYFEGTLQYEVQMDGPEVEALMLNKPNTKMTMHLKGGDYIVRIFGGEYPKLFLFVADSNYEYSMDMANKRAFRYSPHTDLSKAKEENPPQAKATGETQTVNGIECQEYRMEKKGSIFYYYVNNAYRVDIAAFPDPCRAKAAFLANGLEGRIPLKTIKKTKSLTVVTIVKAVQKREFDAEQFRIPVDFEMKNRDYRY